MKSKAWKIGLGCLLVLVAVLTWAFFFWGKSSLLPKDDGSDDQTRVKGRINILLLGTDEKLGTDSRTDTIILASLDTENKKVSLLSIPRDTRVTIPGHGTNKINAANVLGGIGLVEETISNLIQVPVDYYVMTNFEGFKDIVDTLGGVEIDVEQDMHYRVYDGVIDLKKGLQRLNGDKALQYVRFRYDKLGDISRTQRQQKFLTALAKEMIQAKSIIKLPALIPELKNAVETDLNLTQLVSLARDFKDYHTDSITVQTLPGNFVNINGGSYWVIDEGKTRQVVMEVFAGQSSDVIDADIQSGATETAKPGKKKATTPQAVYPQTEGNNGQNPTEGNTGAGGGKDLPERIDQEKNPDAPEGDQGSVVDEIY